MPPDSGGKRKKKKRFPFNNLASLNLDIAKKIAKNVKKRQKTNYGSHSLRYCRAGQKSKKSYLGHGLGMIKLTEISLVVVW